ncbi:ATP-dependent DNA helicase RecG [Blattabacterium cuenoti]|uniref:ATP-dependent DNA helicase RecG n=1 Tax=Blattabacterium cuenoti TaxID=1653831 RepID=UPI00163CC28F|nr:ATP-dependent DNA helicase RecG [Blattabacterium cuenoti]
MSFHVFEKSIVNLGISSHKYQLFNIELNIRTYEDLIFFYPKKYIYSPLLRNISKLKSYININSIQIQIIGMVTKFEEIQYNKFKKKILIANLEDKTGFIELVWFKQINFFKKNIKKYALMLVSGKISCFREKIQIIHPEIQYINDHNYIYNPIYPIYYIPNKLKNYGINNSFLRKILRKLIKELKNDLDIIDKFLIHQNKNLMKRTDALIQIHFPQSLKILSQARYRMKFEELFFLKLSLLSKNKTKNISDSYSFSKLGSHFEKFYNYFLPFSLTEEQKRVFREIRHDLKQPKQMNRLLQGDVGCGKTIIAILAMLLALDNGFQSCLMVPTEVLAIQHYSYIKKMFIGIGINIGLLTSSTPKKTKYTIYNDILTGKISILIGTHSLIQESIKFHNLGLAIIDEQQRFGVEQRSKIWSKNTKPPHILIMTATPIPRTLAMTMYHDLKISIIKDIPLNRKPIITIHLFNNKDRNKVINIIKQQILIGRQVYIVYPIIKHTSSNNQYKSLMVGYKLLKDKIFHNIKNKIGILYGQMSYHEKNLQINRFLRGETKIMVSTTVIEVGVDVPNASVMLIENADCFGLSQLHQLRGRVGRGPHQSYCIMMTDKTINLESYYRIRIMCKTHDGLEIAKEDLNLRGSGDLTGTKQSGKTSLKIANLIKDQELMNKIIPIVKDFVDKYPNFLSYYYVIKNYFYKNYQSFWKHIG